MTPFERLDRFAELDDDWNSYGAPVIAPEALAAARHFLGELPPDLLATVTPTPTTRGGVQLEWHAGGVDVEIECEGSDVRSLYVDGIGFPEAWLVEQLARWLA